MPFKVANRNEAGDVTPFSEMSKPMPELKTVPVGVPSVPGDDGGIDTTSEKGCPNPLRTLDTPPALSENQKGPVGLSASPQGLASAGLVSLASPGTSETRLTCAKPAVRRHRSSRDSTAGGSRRGRRRAIHVAGKNDLEFIGSRPTIWEMRIRACDTVLATS